MVNQNGTETGKKGKNGMPQISPVVKIRIAVCMIASICAAVLKLIGGETYERVKDIYLSYSEKSIVTQTNNDNSDFMRAVRK